MGFLLITILVTTVTATNESRLKHAEENQGNLVNSDYVRDMNYYNLDVLSEWEPVFVDTNTDVHFQITETKKSSGMNCGGGPAYALRFEPMACLFKIIFHFDIKDGGNTVQLGLLFRTSTDNWEWRQIVLDVFPRPFRKIELTPTAQYVTMITTDILQKVRNKESFTMKTKWLRLILFRGIIALDSESEMKLVGNLADKEIPAYYAHPVAMDERVVLEISTLPMELWPKNSQNDAEARTSSVPPTNEDLTQFDMIFDSGE